MAEQTLPQSGLAIQEKHFDFGYVSIGSHPENDIVIHGHQVLPFHATVTVLDGEYGLILLEADAEAMINGQRVQGNSHTFLPNQRLEIGKNILLFQKNGSEGGVNVHVSEYYDTPERESYQLEVDDEPILVNVLTPSQEIDVEQTATFDLEVVNAGPIVASFYISVEGILPDVVEISPQTLNLNEGQRKTVTVSITPPRDASSEAGVYPLEVVVSSPNYRDHAGVGELELTIHPFYDFSLGNLNPRQQRIPWKKKTGTSILPITNTSNTDAEFNVMALDDENGCAFDFDISEDLQLTRQATVSLPPGETLDLPISITPLKQKLFAMRAKRYHYTTTVQVLGEISTPQIVSGSVSSAPLFGWWAIVLTVVSVVLGLFLLLQPTIHTFGVAAGKDIIELGDTTKLTWEVSPFVSRLNITNLEDMEISRGQTALTIAPGKTTTYELVAGNWLSGIFGIDRSRTKTVLVIPPSPEIGVFEIDRDEVDKGQPVNVRWSVTKADTVFLTVDKVVYELPPGEFSGEQQFILNDDSIITLEAVNASGSELRSYFVNVVPPEITVNSFTVWVRPEGAAMDYRARLGMSHDSYLQDPVPGGIPDLNFPVKLVSLVPDGVDEDGGIKYRVEFFQPDRELEKGEQVMLQWDVAGVETVNISPFTETLPNKGLQPFFPQESMNFVMTAVSGELEKLYMLPVKVFDGEPPEAPKIEFFNAAPAELTAPGEIEFAWSVSGEWTRVQISSGDDVAGDYLFAQGFLKYRVAKSTTFILTAWNGDLSSAMPLDVKVSNKLNVKLEIADAYPTGLFQVGGKTTVTIDFPEGPDPLPTGAVYVTDGVSTCTVTLPAKTCDLVFKTPGPKTITASYQGDDIYAQATSAPFTKGNIEVQSAQVILIPVYYDRDFVNKIDDIENVTLRMNKGLGISVEVRQSMLQAPLDDDKSHVSVRVCAVVPNDCIFAGSATVKPKGDKYFADIVIKEFQSAGTYTLIFDFLNDTNSIDPEQITQPNVKVGRLRIELELPFCQDPDTFTDCRLGVPDPNNMTLLFDIKVFEEQKGLSSLLPAPVVNGANSPFVLSVSTNPGAPWTCSIVSRQSPDGPVHKLECTGSLGTPPYTNPLNFEYTFKNTDKNYYMGSNDSQDPFTRPFSISVLEPTRIAVTGLNNMFVGVPFNITPDKIKVFDKDDNPLNNLQIVIENAVDFLDVSQGQGNCEINFEGNLLIQSAGSNCQVYFTKADTVTFIAQTPGDQNYAASSSQLVTVLVDKQSNIVTDWKRKSGGSYIAWDPLNEWVYYQSLDARIELAIENFANDPLIGYSLQVEMTFSNTNLNQACNIVGDKVTETGTNTNKFNVEIAAAGATGAAADFSLVCNRPTSPDQVSLAISFSPDDGSDEAFSFKPGQDLAKSFVIKQGDTINLNVSYGLAYQNSFVTLPDNGIVFDVKEPYKLKFYLSKFYKWVNGTNLSISPETLNINLAADLLAELNTGDSSCDSPVSLQRTNQQLLATYFTWNGGVETLWAYDLVGECQLKFDQAIDFTPPGPEPMTVQFVSSNNSWWKTDKTFNVDAIEKQGVKITYKPNPLEFYPSFDQNLVITVNPDNNGTSLIPVPSDNMFVITFGGQGQNCPTAKYEYVSHTNTTATYKITGSNLCDSIQGTIRYNGTPEFASKTENITFSFVKHSSAVQSILPESPPFVQNEAETVLVKLRDTDPGHPSDFSNAGGEIELKLIDSNDQTILTGFSITCPNATGASRCTNTNGVYTIPIPGNLQSGSKDTAEISITFTAPLQNFRFEARYINSNIFENSALVESVAYSVTSQKPTVTITQPTTGNFYNVPKLGDPVDFFATATDPEDGDLADNIVWKYRLSGGTDQNMGTGPLISGQIFDTGTYIITASITDSSGNTSIDTLTVVVPANETPTITVTSPTPGPVGQNVTFTATADDHEDGDLSDLLDWNSTIDDDLAMNDASFDAVLSVGIHEITVSVTDSHGGYTEYKFTIDVRAP